MADLARSYKYRCYPTAQQDRTLDAWQHACHEVQRLCILQRRIEERQHSLPTHATVTHQDGSTEDRWYRRVIVPPGTTRPSWPSQGREVTEIRRDDPFFRDCPADTMSAVVARVDDAYKRMWESVKAGKGRPKVRWARSHTEVGLEFRGASRGTAITPVSRRFALVRLSGAGKLGPIRVRLHRPIPTGGEIKQAHLTRAADGWYLSFSCVIPQPAPPKPARRDVIGIDLGCIHEGDQQRVAVTDEGHVFTATDGLKRNLRRLATLQKLVSNRRTRGTARHADPHSKRTARRRRRIARLHQRIARQREHTVQYIARRVVDTAEVVAVENIQWGQLRRKGKGRRKRGLNRAMMTVAPGRVVALAEEKAQAAQRRVQKVDPRNTSQACSVCGATGTKKPLSVRQWTCTACAALHDRDVNAARNIRARAIDPDSGQCMPGVRGEGAAGPASKRRSANREGAAAPRRENTPLPTRTTPAGRVQDVKMSAGDHKTGSRF